MFFFQMIFRVAVYIPLLISSLSKAGDEDNFLLVADVGECVMDSK